MGRLPGCPAAGVGRRVAEPAGGPGKPGLGRGEAGRSALEGFLSFFPSLPPFFLWTSGNYFASHFFMGGEKFDMPHPEGYLFGENMDLNFLGNRPVQVSAGSRGNFSP